MNNQPITISQTYSPAGHYDLLVAGGGVAGCAAAVAAARAGKRVLLVEKSLKLGGLATLGLINFFVPMCNGRGKQIIFGMAEEFLRLSLRYGYGDVPADFQNGQIPAEKLREYAAAGKKPPRYAARFSAEIFALTLTELCRNEGVTLLFDSIVSRAVTEDGRIAGVVVENKAGGRYYTAEQFIDASGDGDLLTRAGVPTIERGNFHTYTGYKITLDSCRKAAERGEIGRAYQYCSGGNANLYGDGHPDGVAPYFGGDPADVTRYVVENQLELLEKLKSDDRKTRDVAVLPGMCQFRTSRRIAGEYVLQESDTYRHFADSVGAICDFDRRDYLYEIPYRTLYNRHAPNLLTCGRCAAGDGYAWDVLRVIPPAILTGQAAGVAACLAIDGQVPVGEIDVSLLQQTLAAQNVVLHFDDGDVPEVSDDTIEYND